MNNPAKAFFQSDPKKVKAHLFIGRTGKSFSQIGLGQPWRATKFETKVLPASISRGLFLHIELVQPRTVGPKASWYYLAPAPGFTSAQYSRLALVYLAASLRAKTWLVPVFHRVLDDDISGAHDDPQQFDLNQFSSSLDIVYHQIKP